MYSFLLISLGILLNVAYIADAFYLSGWAPRKFHPNEKVDLWYNKISSEKTQLAFAYIDLPFVCKPSGDLKFDPLNIGEVFRGDRTVKSGHSFPYLENKKCVRQCENISLDEQSLADLKRYIGEDYRIEWILDDLPAGSFLDPDDRTKLEPGFQIGYSSDVGTFLYNHVEITILYTRTSSDAQNDESVLITGFRVSPRSVNWGDRTPCGTENIPNEALEIKSGMPAVAYTYSVEWREAPDSSWSTRWNAYIDSSNSQIHWYSIINSLMLLVVLTIIVAFIMLATLRRDIAAYNDEEENNEDIVGWKLVHGDVFRSPQRLKLLAPFVGSGVQIFISSFFTILFGVFGVLNPSYRGGIMQYALVFWSLAGFFAGYYSARLLKAFGNPKTTNWKTNAFWTATVFPLFLFTTLCVLNTFNWAADSSNALPAGTFVALLAIWLLISVPLVMIGSYFGQKKQAIEHPVRTNQIPRQIPPYPFYFRTIPSIAIGGFVPFTVVFMELYFILKSMWQDQYYYMYGFLFLVFCLLIVTCIEVTIVMIYFQLLNEDYRWQWKSFLVSSSSTWHIFAFSILQYLSKGDYHVGMMAGVVYFTYLVVGLAVYFVCTGMIGFWMCYWFLRQIYGAVKID